MFSFRSLKATTRMAAAAAAALTACALAVPAAYAGPAAPSTSAPPALAEAVSSSAAVASGCTANILGPTADHNHERIGQWWYLRTNGCVGTVNTTTYVAAGGRCVNPQLRVYGNGVLMFKAWIVIRGTQQKFFACPSHYRTFKWPWSVHRTFPFPIEVKATAEIHGGGGELGPAIAVVH